MRKYLLLLPFFALIILGFTVTPDNSGFLTEETLIETSNSKPDTLTWKMLSMVKFTDAPKSEKFPYGTVIPEVNPALKFKDKKLSVISGFIIPVTTDSYALSKNVYASCFFCGKAGPETVVGIKFKGELPKLKTDQYVTLEGYFRINETDPEDWLYHIENARIVPTKKKG